MLWPGKGLFHVSDPFLILECEGKAIKGLSTLQRFKWTCEPKFSLAESTAEECQELSAALRGKCFHREKELRMASADPACLVERAAAGGHEAVDMRMRQQLLIPGM